MKEVQVRAYVPDDYQAVKRLYQHSGWFDPETDAEERLNVKSAKDAQSLLVATHRNDPDIIGTVSLIEDGRIALFFRLVTIEGEDEQRVRETLLTEGSTILKQRGYNEAHIIVPEDDTKRQKEYKANGFQRGNPYRWLWKKLE